MQLPYSISFLQWQSAVLIHNRGSQNKDTNYTKQHKFSIVLIENLCSRDHPTVQVFAGTEW